MNLPRRPLERYGILDPEGRVVRWVYEPPTAPGYAYLTQRERRTRRPAVKIDLTRFEPALF